jgi:Uma2 family endonuclease
MRLPYSAPSLAPPWCRSGIIRCRSKGASTPSVHGILQAELAFQLANVAKKTGNLVVVGDTGIEFFEGTLRACDAALIRTPVGSKMLDPSQILVAVEVSVSTLATDLGEKASDYARAGVAALWVIDPDASIIHVMRDPSKAGYATKSVVRFGEPLAVPGTDETIIVEQQ